MFETPFIDLPPLHHAAGRVQLPGSKSISNRVLLLAGLCAGQTIIHDLLESDDTSVMLTALRGLGCSVDPTADGLQITGIGGQLATRRAEFFLGNAGTAMRPLAAALALLATTQRGEFELRGVARMHERPIGDLVDALRQLGCGIDYLGVAGYPPLRLLPGDVRFAELQPIRVRGDVSSQFLTALLLALPLIADGGERVIEVDGELISKPYVDITLNLLRQFGVDVVRDGWQRFTIAQGSRFQSPGHVHVEADASSASYFVALGAIAADRGAIRIDGVGTNSIQGDIRFVDAALAMGAQITSGPGWIEVRRGRFPLLPIRIDCNHIPDAAMTLAMMAMYADGVSRLDNIASWRVKETDRIAAMSTELTRLGARVHEGPDFIEITPPARWHAATLHTYDDHRMAMCLSLAAFNPLLPDAGNGVPVRILDPRCVAKTYPDYFETLFGVVETAVEQIPVLTIDGPTASGKGTVASAVAQALGYHFLDSGAVYRATALAAMRRAIAADDAAQLTALAATLDLRFIPGAVLLDGDDVAELLRAEDVGAMASRISSIEPVREALRRQQLAFRRVPGLVADGRDMGTRIFPDAELKVFLTASAATRAERRHKQLISKGISANIDDLRKGLEARDERDRMRAASPLKPAEDALLLDNSSMSVEQSVELVLNAWERRRPFA